MFNLGSITNENNNKHNEKWPYIPDHPYKIITVGGSGSGKTNALINLINEQNDIYKIYLYWRDLSEPKYEYLIKKGEDVGIKHLNNPMHLSSVEIWWMLFRRISMIAIKSEKEKNWLVWWHDCRY